MSEKKHSEINKPYDDAIKAADKAIADADKILKAVEKEADLGKKEAEPVPVPVAPVIKRSPEYRYEQQRLSDAQPVKGIFKYYEVPGGSVSFPYRAYKHDKIVNYTLRDGEMYTLPRGVARHLNKNGWYPEHAYKMDENGKNAVVVGKKVHRFGFQSLEFMDLDDVEQHISPLVTVSSL